MQQQQQKQQHLNPQTGEGSLLAQEIRVA